MPQVWFVTGSSRGLGRAVIEKALDTGASVIATARNLGSLQDTVEKYGADRCLAVPLDVTNEDQVVAAVQAGFDHFGRIDVVVNNAGYFDIVPIEDISSAAIRKQMDTTFMGVVYVTKAVLPILRKQNSGHIFQVSSVGGGRLATPGLGAYQSAKWAVGGFSSALAQEIAPFGIKVTVLEPGAMRTSWTETYKDVQVSAPYKSTVGPVADMFAQLSGNEASLPEKISQIIVDLTGSEQPPLRLLIGSDAVELAEQAAKELLISDQAWRSVSESSGET